MSSAAVGDPGLTVTSALGLALPISTLIEASWAPLTTVAVQIWPLLVSAARIVSDVRSVRSSSSTVHEIANLSGEAWSIVSTRSSNVLAPTGLMISAGPLLSPPQPASSAHASSVVIDKRMGISSEGPEPRAGPSGV